jgi:predicted DNA-binding protein YlxM (UPF0122 family)
MNVNKSIAQLHKEIETARREALVNFEKNPNKITKKKHERSDSVVMFDDGMSNTLADIVQSKRNTQSNTGVQSIPIEMQEKIEKIFTKQQHQYKLLGLYYAAGFTRQKIADDEGLKRQNVGTSLTQAVKRLQKYLSPSEYDSIRWALGDHKPLQGNCMTDDLRERIALHKTYTGVQPVRHGQIVDGEIVWHGEEQPTPSPREYEFENDRPPSYYTPFKSKRRINNATLQGYQTGQLGEHGEHKNCKGG